MLFLHGTTRYKNTTYKTGGRKSRTYSFCVFLWEALVINRASASNNGIINGNANIALFFQQPSDKQMVEFFNTHYTAESGIVNGTTNKQQKQILEQVLSGQYRSTELNLI